MKSSALPLWGGALLLAGGLAATVCAQAPVDPGEQRATQRFHILAGNNASTFLVFRQHTTGPKQRDPSMTVVHDSSEGHLDVYTRSFHTAPRWRVDAKNRDEILVYRLDRGNVRNDPSSIIKRAGEELSVYRMAGGGRVARYRSAVIDVEPSNHRTLVYGTGTGDAKLPRAGRRIEHEDFKALEAFTYSDLPLEELTGILGGLDMVRGN